MATQRMIEATITKKVPNGGTVEGCMLISEFVGRGTFTADGVLVTNLFIGGDVTRCVCGAELSVFDALAEVVLIIFKVISGILSMHL